MLGLKTQEGTALDSRQLHPVAQHGQRTGRNRPRSGLLSRWSRVRIPPGPHHFLHDVEPGSDQMLLFRVAAKKACVCASLGLTSIREDSGWVLDKKSSPPRAWGMTLGSSSRMGSHKISVNAGPHMPPNNCSAALGDSLQRQGLSPPVTHEEGREISPQRMP